MGFQLCEFPLFGPLVTPSTHYYYLTPRLVVVISLPLLITNNVTTRTIHTTSSTTTTNLKLRDAFSTLPSQFLGGRSLNEEGMETVPLN